MLNPKKVMMFSSVHAWNDTRIFYKEAMSLADAGFTVDFYAVDNGMKVEKHPNLNIFLLAENHSKWRRPRRWYQLYKAAKETDASFYHIHDPELLLLFPSLKRKKKKATFIYDMHENFPAALKTKKWIPKGLRGIISWLVSKFENHLLRFCDYTIFAESSYVKEYQHLKCKKIIVRNFPKYMPKITRKTNESFFTLIYVGDITKQRGLWEMLNVIDQLNHEAPGKYKLKLLGPISETLYSEVRPFLHAHDLDFAVEFYGRVPYPEIWKTFGEADLGLCLLHPIPNYLHSMATKLYEYMAAEIPVLASSFPDWETFIKQYRIGEVASPFDTKKLVSIIKKRANNRDFFRIEGKNGRLAYEENYHWEKEVEKMLNGIYQKDQLNCELNRKEI